jgi:outer membrane protein OmpA-like peptidoglycan-associated protein/tetratricopeptide (TPR) repeat protein
MSKSFILLCCLLLASFWMQAQDYSITNRSSIKKFEKALDLFRNHSDDKALAILDKLVKLEPQFLEAYLLRSEIYHERKESDKEIADLTTIQRINPAYNPKISFFLGEKYFEKADYEKALEILEDYLEVGDEANKLKKAEYLLACCSFAIESIRNAPSIELISLGNNINTAYNDMMPALTADESMLIYTVDMPIYENLPYSQKNRQEDFFVSFQENGKWTQAISLGAPVNTPGNEGALSISADGQLLVYASSNLEGQGSTDLYQSTLKNGKWTNPINLGPKVNSKHWDSQPSISADGRKLFFISSRPGGQGKSDIWYSEKDETGAWKEAVNLGPTINTPMEENSPFIHQDGTTLYFASNGQIGMGGFDLYKTNVLQIDQPTQPVNLGYPINTEKNEEFMIINARGNIAYLSSERGNSQNKDLYYFEIPQKARPTPVSWVSGMVYDAITRNPLEAQFSLVDLSSGVEIIQSQSGSDGNYLVVLPSGKEYAFKCSKTGYLFHSENFSLSTSDENKQAVSMNIALQPMQTGKSTILRNVFFATNEFTLSPVSELELMELVRFMNENPAIRIEIGGHTDNQGDKEYNQILSENRARSVQDFLISNGIAARRVNHKGYGINKPIRENETEEGRAFNRRTEFTILATQ